MRAADPMKPRSVMREWGYRSSEFLDEIEQALRHYEENDGIAIPIGYLVLTARL